MKRILTWTLLTCCFFFSTTNVHAVTTPEKTIKANLSFKALTTKGRLPQTIGYVGKSYINLIKAVPGKRRNGEGAIFYMASETNSIYGFSQSNKQNGQPKYYVTSKEKVQLISRVYPGSLTNASLTKLFGKPIYFNSFGKKVKLYKSGNLYIGYRSYLKGNKSYTNISIGTKEMMIKAGLQNSYY